MIERNRVFAEIYWLIRAIGQYICAKLRTRYAQSFLKDKRAAYLEPPGKQVTAPEVPIGIVGNAKDI